jgi:hypothetical protein
MHPFAQLKESAAAASFGCCITEKGRMPDLPSRHPALLCPEIVTVLILPHNGKRFNKAPAIHFFLRILNFFKTISSAFP